MTRVFPARETLRRAGMLLLCLQSGCFSCGSDGLVDERCAGLECNEAICEGDTVVWCPCLEDEEGGIYPMMKQADCAARGERCVVASDGSDGTLREAICLDSCDTPGAYACREGSSEGGGGGGLDEPFLYSCEPYDVNAPHSDQYEDKYGVDPGAPHEPNFAIEEHPESTYDGLLEWAGAGLYCTSCQSSCGCDDGDRCQDGTCVPEDYEDGLVCCAGTNGDPCTTGSPCENADGSLGVCE